MEPREFYESVQGDGFVILVIPRKPTGEKIRLTTRNGPLGTIRCVNRQGHTVAAFDRAAVS